MTGRVDHPLYSSGAYAPEDIDSVLDAAAAFAQHFDLDRELVLQEIAAMLQRRVEFGRLKAQFGISLAEQ